MQALVRAARPRPRLEDGWDDPAWAAGRDARARPLPARRAATTGPRTRARLLHDGRRPRRDLPRRGPLRALGARALRRSRLRGQLRRDLPAAAARPRLPELRDELRRHAAARATSPTTGACRAASRRSRRSREAEGRQRARALVAARARRARSSRRPLDWQLAFFIPRALARALHWARSGRSPARRGAPTSTSAATRPRTRTGPRGPRSRRATSTCPTASGRCDFEA